MTWWHRLCRERARAERAGRTDWQRKRQLRSVCAPHSPPNKFSFSLSEPVSLLRSPWQRHIISSLITEQPGAPAAINVLLTRRLYCLERYFRVHKGCQTVFSLCQQDYGLSVTQSCFCQHPFVISVCTLGCNVNTRGSPQAFYLPLCGCFLIRSLSLLSSPPQ